MDAVIRYRHYRWDELHPFLDNKVFYSRSSRFRGNCPGRPDVLRTEYGIKPGVTGNTGSVRVMLELNEARVLSPGRHKGRSPSCYEMRISENMNAVYVLTKLLAFLDKIVTDLPLLLYATAHRQVSDYASFMSSETPRVPYGELAELVRGRMIAEAPVGAGPFRIARLPGGDWAAWINGDELIPVFSDERQVRRFITQRTAPHETVGGIFDKMPQGQTVMATDLALAGGYAPAP